MLKRFWADFALLAVAFVWGTTFTIVKDAVELVPVYFFLAVRFLIAAIILAIIFRHALKKLDAHTLLAGTLIGLFLFAGYAFQTIGLQYTTPSKAGFITGLSVVIVPLLSTLLMKKPPSLGAGLGTFCATVGLAMLSLDRSFRLAYGDTLILLCAISFALHILAVGKFTTTADPLQLTIIQIAFVSIASGLCSLLTERNMPIILNTDVWIAIIVTAVFATAAAFLIQNVVQKFTTPTRTALIFTMEPVFAALYSVLIGGEHLPANVLAGCALIFAGMVMAEVKIGRRKDRVKVGSQG